jgi:transposase
MLRPSFVPPAEMRVLRDYTRLRAELTEERSRHKQRMEKLLEDALIKLPTVATDIFGKCGRAMLLAAGLDGHRWRTRPQRSGRDGVGQDAPQEAALVQALTGGFDEHHGGLARILLDEVDALTVKIDQLTDRIDALINQLPAAATPEAPGGGGPTSWSLGVLDRLDEIPGIARHAAQVVVAEIGLDMAQFPSDAHLVSRAKLSPRAIESGPRSRGGNTGKGNPYLKGTLGEVAAAAPKSHTFLGERYRRLVRRIGKRRALVAVSRSILVIVWHLLANPTTRFNDLGSDYFEHRINTDRRTRDLVRQLQSFGHIGHPQPRRLTTTRNLETPSRGGGSAPHPPTWRASPSRPLTNHFPIRSSSYCHVLVRNAVFWSLRPQCFATGR